MRESKDAPSGNPITGKNSTAMYENHGGSPDGCCEVGNTESNPYGPYLPSGK
jgi:hypothetical protein